MIAVGEYFRSVEHIWILWFVSLALLAWLTRRALAGSCWRDWKLLLQREEGAVYTMTFTLTFPIFMMLVCLVIETTLFLTVKIGTVYAAYAAVRANIVWQSTPSSPLLGGNSPMLQATAEEKTRQAAAQAMAAFGSHSGLHLRGAGVSGAAPESARHYYEAYKKYSGGDAAASYIIGKYRFADRATTVSIDPTSPKRGDDVTVKVTYEMPFQIPGIGRILGQKASWPGASFYTYKISSAATLQCEAPITENQRLGIDYVARQN